MARILFVALVAALSGSSQGRAAAGGAGVDRAADLVNSGLSRVLAAEEMVRRGDLADAATVYRDLLAADPPKPLRLAAARGVLLTMPPGRQATLVTAWLADPDSAKAEIAAVHLAELPAGDLAAVAEAYAGLPSLARVRLLRGLGARGAPAIRAKAEAACRDAEGEVRRAAVETLGEVGDERSVPSLLEALGEDELAPLVLTSLVRLPGASIDAVLAGALREARSPGLRLHLLDVLRRRRSGGAVGAFLAVAEDADPALRSRALAGLRELAEPRHLADLIALLGRSPPAEDVSALQGILFLAGSRAASPAQPADALLALLPRLTRREQEAVAAVLARLGDPRGLAWMDRLLATSDAGAIEAATAALAEWQGPGALERVLRLLDDPQPVERRARLLRALPRAAGLAVGEDESRLSGAALARLREARREGAPALRRAAVLGLAEWPGGGTEADLRQVAQSDPDALHQALAIEGLVRVARWRAGRSKAEALDALREAWTFSRRPEDRHLILGTAAELGTAGALGLVLEILGAEPAARAEALAAARRLVSALAGTADGRSQLIARLRAHPDPEVAGLLSAREERPLLP